MLGGAFDEDADGDDDRERVRGRRDGWNRRDGVFEGEGSSFVERKGGKEGEKRLAPSFFLKKKKN